MENVPFRIRSRSASMVVLILSVMTTDAAAFLSTITCGNCACPNSSLSPTHLCQACGLSFIKRLSTALKLQGKWSCGRRKQNGKLCGHSAYPSESTVYLHQYACGLVTRDEVLYKKMRIQLLVIAKCLWCKLRNIIITSCGGVRDEASLRKDFYRSFLHTIRKTHAAVLNDDYPNALRIRNSLALMSPNCMAAIRTRFSLDPDAMAVFSLNYDREEDQFFQLFPDDLARPIVSRRMLLTNKFSSWFPNLLTTYPVMIHVILQEISDLLKDPILDGATLLAKIVAARLNHPFQPPTLAGSDYLNLMEKITIYAVNRPFHLLTTDNSPTHLPITSHQPAPTSSPQLSSTPQLHCQRAGRSRITDESALLATLVGGGALDNSVVELPRERLLRDRCDMRAIIGSPEKYSIPMDDTRHFDEWLSTFKNLVEQTVHSHDRERGSCDETSSAASIRDSTTSRSNTPHSDHSEIWSKLTQPVQQKL